MKYTAIIGAGPMGLYLAYKLYEQGLRNIVIYDLRAGEYVRPGHVNHAQFLKLETELQKDVLFNRVGHIKDFERALFQEMIDLAIPIKKKEFIRFGETQGKKSIIVKGPEGVEEEIECDYAFDCTGGRRTLISKINELVSPAPFTITPIKKHVEIKQHLIAYVYMSEDNFNRIPRISVASHINFLTQAQHISAINRMRSFGWQDLGLPQLYGVYFGKNKVCLYMECPDNLPPAAYEAWVKTTIDISTKSTDISFSQLPPSKKYKSKPRLTSYTVNPRELTEAGYESTKYPTIIPIGDSQIEPHPSLAHGIANGMERIDVLIYRIDIIDGQIDYFYPEEYQGAIKLIMDAHKNAIIQRYQLREAYSYDMLLQAKIHYTDALIQAPQKTALAVIVVEVNAAIAYQKALALKTSSAFEGNRLSPIEKTEVIVQSLVDLAELSLYAYTNLPAHFAYKKAQALTMFRESAKLLNDCGIRYLKACDPVKALTTFQESLKIYQSPYASSPLRKATVDLNLVITFYALNKHAEVITQGCTALDLHPKTPEFAELRKKLLYCVLRTLKITAKTPAEKQTAIKLLEEHSELLAAAIDKKFYSFFGKKPEAPALPRKNVPPVSTNPFSFLMLPQRRPAEELFDLMLRNFGCALPN